MSFTDRLAKNYAAQQECGTAKDCNPTMLEAVQSQKQRAEAELARLAELEELLKAHPETQRILELIGMRGL